MHVSWEPSVFPDAEALVVRYLTRRTELDGVPIGIRLPDTSDGTQAAVVVNRVGGAFTEYQLLDAPLVEIETYGSDKATAHELARRVRGLLSGMPSVVHEGALVSSVSEQDGPTWEPDADRPEAIRYVQTARLLVRPFDSPPPNLGDASLPPSSQ